MQDIHRPITASKISELRQRSAFNDVSSSSMSKLERCLIHRSIIHCFKKGYFSLIRYLLESGAGDPRECDEQGRTGLIYCCFIDHNLWAQNLALNLLEYSARIEDQDQRGLNALHYAIIKQRLALIRQYLSSLDFNLNETIDSHGNTFLHYACSTGNPNIVRLILDVMKRYSIDITTKNKYGATAYDIACQLKNEACQDLLRKEFIIREQQRLPSAKPNVTFLTDKLLNEKHSSASMRKRPGTASTRTRPVTASTTQRPVTRTEASSSITIPSSKNVPQRSLNTLNSSKENLMNSSSVLIDPAVSHNIKLKRNENADISLTKQVKNRFNSTPVQFVSQSTVFNSSSSSAATWRDDLANVIGQWQSIRTPSYRKTVHPPLSRELPCELYDKLYGLPEGAVHDCSNHRPLVALPSNSSEKTVRRRRSSSSSIKSLIRMKK